MWFSKSTLALCLSAFTKMIAAEAELGIENVVVNECERKATHGDKLSMHYRGTLADTGKQFDASYDRGTPFEFDFGAGRVIRGWDQGLIDMCPGDKRVLTIPPHLGYGDRGAGGVIPGGATLKFEVELLAIKKGGQSWKKDEL
jgi:FKBP-type peptidyl-prolyl cis-trans isomerase